jgi:plasmid stability protein
MIYHNDTGMKSIHIRQIDEDVLDALKRRAQLHRRSLQKEIEVLLEDAARMTPVEQTNPTILAGLRTVACGQNTSTWSREDIYADQGR